MEVAIYSPAIVNESGNDADDGTTCGGTYDGGTAGPITTCGGTYDGGTAGPVLQAVRQGYVSSFAVSSPEAQDETAQVLFSIICENGMLSYPSLMLCSKVCRPWYEAVKFGVGLLKHLYFNPYTNVACDKVVSLLTHDKVMSLSSLTHKQLKTIDLRGCRCNNETDLIQILTQVDKLYPGVTLINRRDCAAKSVLFAVAFHARKCFGAATPSELYDCIKHRGHITMILNLLIEKVAYSRHGPTSA